MTTPIANRPLLLIGLALAVVMFSSSAARAFYWFDWPGSQSQTAGTANVQTNSTGSTNGNQDTVVGIGGGEVDPGSGDPGVEHAPEPASILAGLIGLGFVGLVCRRQRR